MPVTHTNEASQHSELVEEELVSTSSTMELVEEEVELVPSSR